MITFTVPGVPQPGGSKKTAYNQRTGRRYIVEDCKGNPSWRRAVSLAARVYYRGAPLAGAIRARFEFVMPRPKYHFDAAGRVKPQYRAAPHTVAPDTTKLIRAAEDSLTGIIWRDDCLVVSQSASKRYAESGESPGVTIEVGEV